MTKINSKQCTKCDEVKAHGEFYKHKSGKNGMRATCKDCENEYRRARRGTFEYKSNVAIMNARKNAKKYGVESTLTLAEARAVLSAERCSYCHAETSEMKRTIDHVIPMQEGGANTFENVVMACLTCNTAKNSRPAYDFIMKQRNSDATRLLLGTLGERMDIHPIEALRRLERQQTAYSERLFRAKYCGAAQ